MRDHKHRLLLIDDEPLICSFISTVARQMGFIVTATGDAEEFRECYRNDQPSIVILDLQMPKVDGVEILTFLANEKSRASILVASGMDMKTLATADNLAGGLPRARMLSWRSRSMSSQAGWGRM